MSIIRGSIIGTTFATTIAIITLSTHRCYPADSSISYLVSTLVYGRKERSTVLLYSFGVQFGVVWCDFARFLVRGADPRR